MCLHIRVHYCPAMEQNNNVLASSERLSEFGLKLGYTQQQVEVALGCLGSEASEDKLLAELLKNGLDLSCGEEEETTTLLRHVVIDGANVALHHGGGKVFSGKGIWLAVEHFKSKGHEVTVFLSGGREKDLGEGWREKLAGYLKEAPLGPKGRRCYDDRFILQLASSTKGIVLSNDAFRDISNESPEFKHVAETKRLPFTFCGDLLMLPEDPCGRGGPSLLGLLTFGPQRPQDKKCPYGSFCTYGAKCKFGHEERRRVPVSAVLRSQARKVNSVPLVAERQLARTRSDTANRHLPLQRKNAIDPCRVDDGRRIVYNKMSAIFPSWQVDHVLNLFPEEEEASRLCRHLVEIFHE